MLSPLLGWGALGKSLPLSVLQLLILQNKIITVLTEDQRS